MNDTPAKPKSQRLLSLDAYRGFTMLLLVAGGFGIRNASQQALAKLPEDSAWLGFWEFMRYQFSHVDWLGCSVWDLIQPSFMFLVGTSMAYSYANRAARGDSYKRLLGHAVRRAIVLILLGVFLRSNSARSTYWTFEDVISQIGLGYVFLFLLWDKKPKIQLSAAVLILVAYWTLFAAWPLPPADFDYAAAHLPSEPILTGFEAHWNRGTSPANYFDIWMWERLPTYVNHVKHHADYATLNFIPSLATMIFGLLAGGVLRSDRSNHRKLNLLIVWGVWGIVSALVIDALGICPIVKKAWTPSWVLFSSGWAVLFLAAFFAVIDVARYRRWAFPGIVFGVNSIAAYIMGALIAKWIVSTIHIHTRLFAYVINDNLLPETPSIFAVPFGPTYGPIYAPILESCTRLLVMFLILLWMYRRKIFLRI